MRRPARAARKGGCRLASDDTRSSTPAEAFGRAQALLGGSLLVASDFDGTLAKPTLDPWSSAIVPAAQAALRQLAAADAVHVALISGRTVPDLAARTSIGSASYHGDHGAEWAQAPSRFVDGGLDVQREAVPPELAALAGRLKVAVPRAVGESWLVLEDKGPSLTFHFRAAPDPDVARARVLEAVDAVDPAAELCRSGGRRSVELRPPGAPSKGDTLRRLLARRTPDAAIMLGDDANDVLAFAALREARADGRVDGLAIAVVSPAAPPDAADHADLVLPSAEAVAAFLGLVAAARVGG